MAATAATVAQAVPQEHLVPAALAGLEGQARRAAPVARMVLPVISFPCMEPGPFLCWVRDQTLTKL
ncbi:MAG: hypothetical protein U0103_17255 [Candidatus Obscuribacterales bacterium]